MISTAQKDSDLWARLAALVPASAIAWRQDGRPIARDGKYFARFVAYIEANTVRERLDSIVPGEWDLTLELLPAVVPCDGDDAGCSFKARLQILGVIREDVGTGRDYKQAATDAFKRAAVRFGVGHELYNYEQNWVQVDGDGKYAKPLEDPGEVYARRYGRARPQSAHPETSRQTNTGNGSATSSTSSTSTRPRPSLPEPDEPTPPEYLDGDHIDNRAPLDSTPFDEGREDPQVPGEPMCPKCGGRMWDNRLSKRNPKAPDYKCRSRSCDGVIWPPRPAGAGPARGPARSEDEAGAAIRSMDDDELPF